MNECVPSNPLHDLLCARCRRSGSEGQKVLEPTHELPTLRGSEWWGDNSWMSCQFPRGEEGESTGKCRGQRRGGASRDLFHVCWGSSEPVDKRCHRGKGEGRRQDPNHRSSGPLIKDPTTSTGTGGQGYLFHWSETKIGPQ